MMSNRTKLKEKYQNPITKAHQELNLYKNKKLNNEGLRLAYADFLNNPMRAER